MMSLPLSEEIQKYTVPWLQLDWPIDWPQIFDRPGDLVLEIGFGNGHFLSDMATARPDACFVGIERAWGSMRRLFRRLNALKLNHVRAIEGDAAFLLQHGFAPQSLSEIWINFSDPWPKERHHNRRLIQDTFVKILAERLKPDGGVTIATDHADYATWITDILTRQSDLQSIYATPSVRQLPGRTPTKYEQKAIDAGVPIHYFAWRRKSELSVETHIQKVGNMPNIVLEGAYQREDILTLIEQAADQVWRENHRDMQVVIKMTDIYCQLPDNHGLISVMVREGELAQYFGISLLFRKNNQLLVKLAPMGQPRPTWGVKKAVQKVADLILETHPHLWLASSTVGL
ncbi:MAG: tRNA (guanosine(46)-N7)-methyltransferase TrmB [Gemmatimonadetes bacterium]|nr:tRNA (guanosine(46)-N7)-methyltransferase TrmB [Gemmatimonadota bacterium]